MARGVVHKFDADKGFGFIRPDDGTRDVFLHVSVLRNIGLGSIAEKTAVKYESEDGSKGPRAKAVELV